MGLHPFIVTLLAALQDLPALSAGTPDAGRALVAAGRPKLRTGPEMQVVRDLSVPGRGGKIPTRLFIPRDASEGVIVYLHGGGWVLGALDDYDTYLRSLAQRSGCAVLAVGYRLAPEHRFPAGLQDCEDVLATVLNGTMPGVPGGPVVVAGDSAGANLATVCCTRLPDPNRISLQVLYYPVTDADFTTASYRAHGTGLPLTAQDMRWFFGHYAPEALWHDPAISPLHWADLSRMPPTHLITAEYDVLCDEGEAYADRLAAAGVPVVQRRVPGVTHGFIRLHNLFDVADAELTTVSDAIRATVITGR